MNIKYWKFVLAVAVGVLASGVARADGSGDPAVALLGEIETIAAAVGTGGGAGSFEPLPPQPAKTDIAMQSVHIETATDRERFIFPPRRIFHRAAPPITGAARRRSPMFVFEIGQSRLANYTVNRLRAEMATRGHSEHQAHVGKRHVRSSVHANLQRG